MIVEILVRKSTVGDRLSNFVYTPFKAILILTRVSIDRLWEAVKNGILTVRLTVVRGRVSPLGPDREQM